MNEHPIIWEHRESRTAVADAEDSAELVDMRRRFWFAAALTWPLVPTSMGDTPPGQPISSLISMRTSVWLELALATSACVWPAWPFLHTLTMVPLGVPRARFWQVDEHA